MFVYQNEINPIINLLNNVDYLINIMYIHILSNNL